MSGSLVETLDEREALHELAGQRTLDILEQRRLAKAHRRGWVVRRFLLAADVAGLLACLRDQPVDVPRPLRREVRPQDRSAPLRRDAPPLDPDRPPLRSLQLRRSAYEPPDDGRGRPGLPPRHRLHVALLRLHVADRLRASGRSEAAPVLGVCVSPRSACAGGCPVALALAPQLHPEHGDRRRGRRRPVHRREAASPPGVRGPPGRFRRRRAEGAAREPSAN